VRYPHDLRRADALFAEAGLRRGPDGVFTSAAGARMVLLNWTNPGVDNEQQLAITGDQWKSFGVVTEHIVLSQPQANDRRYRSTFLALNSAGWPIATVRVSRGGAVPRTVRPSRTAGQGKTTGATPTLRRTR